MNQSLGSYDDDRYYDTIRAVEKIRENNAYYLVKILSCTAATNLSMSLEISYPDA